jgi:hypothetical protein
MRRYREGKWSPNTSTDEVDASVMKFIGRTDFSSTRTSEAIVPATEHTGESMDAHRVLFEYMQHFENQAEREPSTYLARPSEGAAPHLLLPQDKSIPVLPELATSIGIFEYHLSDISSGNIGQRNDPSSLFELSNGIGQTNGANNWPSNSLYGNTSTVPNPSLYKQDPGTSSQTLLFEDLFLDQGTGSGYNDDQEAQVWEHFLSTLIS